MTLKGVTSRLTQHLPSRERHSHKLSDHPSGGRPLPRAKDASGSWTALPTAPACLAPPAAASASGSFLGANRVHLPERGTLSFQRGRVSTVPADGDDGFSPRSFDFGRKAAFNAVPRSAGPLAGAPPRSEGLATERRLTTPRRSDRGGAAGADGGAPTRPQRAPSVSAPSRTRSASKTRAERRSRGGGGGGGGDGSGDDRNGLVVRVEEAPTDGAHGVTLIHVDAADVGGSSFAACARAATGANASVSSAHFAIDADGRGHTTLGVRARPGDAGAEERQLIAATVARIEQTLGGGGGGGGSGGRGRSGGGGGTTPDGAPLRRAADGSPPAWVVLGRYRGGATLDLTALKVVTPERRGLAESLRTAVARLVATWAGADVLFLKITTAKVAHLFFCVVAAKGGAPPAGAAAPTLVDALMGAVDGVLGGGPRVKAPGAMTLAALLGAAPAALADPRITLHEEAAGASTICSVTGPHRYGLLVDTLAVIEAAGLAVCSATVQLLEAREEGAHQFAGARGRACRVKHMCLEVTSAADGGRVIGTPTEARLRGRLHQVIADTGVSGESAHYAVVETSDGAAALRTVGTGGGDASVCLASRLIRALAAANVRLTVTPRTTGGGGGGAARSELVLLATSNAELLSVADTLAYTASAFFAVTGLGGALDHPAAPPARLPPFPVATRRVLPVFGDDSGARSKLLSALPE